MGDLYNQGNKPTIYCRGVELYPSTSVGEVMWAGDTLVHCAGTPTDLCHVIVYNNEDGKKYMIADATTLDATKYTPIGIVVIPTNHNVYGTGECGVMALMSASLTTPDIGEPENIMMRWGADTELPEIRNSSMYVYTRHVYSDSKDAMGTINQVSLPSDKFTGFYCSTDPLVHYRNSPLIQYGAPSPYLEDETRNPVYYQTDPPSSTNNGLSDFAGRENTKILCSKAITQANWKTDNTLSNNSDTGYYPSACACWRYHTLGTSSGDWFLPACGEFGYTCVRSKRINDIISTLQNNFSIDLCKLDNEPPQDSLYHIYITSSEHGYPDYDKDVSSCIYIANYNGTINYVGKSVSCYTRPFTRMRVLPSTLQELVWPFQETADKPCSLPKYTNAIIFLGVVPPEHTSSASSRTAKARAAKTVAQTDGSLGNLITNQEYSMNSLLETSSMISGNLPTNRMFFDVVNNIQIPDMTTLPDGFYPMAVFEDANYDGLFQWNGVTRTDENNNTSTYIENYFTNKLFTIGGPEINLGKNVANQDVIVPTSWVLKIGNHYMSQNYGMGQDFNSEDLYMPGETYSREALYQEMLKSSGIVTRL